MSGIFQIAGLRLLSEQNVLKGETFSVLIPNN